MNVSKPGGTLQDAIKNTDLAVYASILATHQVSPIYSSLSQRLNY